MEGRIVSKIPFWSQSYVMVAATVMPPIARGSSGGKHAGSKPRKAPSVAFCDQGAS